MSKTFTKALLENMNWEAVSDSDLLAYLEDFQKANVVNEIRFQHYITRLMLLDLIDAINTEIMNRFKARITESDVE